MERSEKIGELAKALAKFQSTVSKIKKDTTNPFFKKKYASLANILDVITTPLSECGLSITQMPEGNGQLTTLLMHGESGEFVMASYDIHASKNDPQGIGSAITYARRYSIGAVLNLNIDEDDDGNAATLAKEKEMSQPKYWQDELAKCKSIADVTKLYGSNEAITSQDNIKKLFTTRKGELK